MMAVATRLSMTKVHRKTRLAPAITLFVVSVAVWAQEPLAISDKENLPPGSLWENYAYALHASSGIAPYRWSLVSGSLPRGFRLNEFGELTGIPEEAAPAEFTVLVRDNSDPPQQQSRRFVLSVETPLVLEWDRKVRIDGQRIDGSIKVSNHTGRDFDLTLVVLAVNEIGRATAIGYQHFSLKKGTRDMGIPFGDAVSRGTYAVNVDVVGEEPLSNRIFRARLVTDQQQVTQGP
jgi:hypothetical protein